MRHFGRNFNSVSVFHFSNMPYFHRFLVYLTRSYKFTLIMTKPIKIQKPFRPLASGAGESCVAGHRLYPTAMVLSKILNLKKKSKFFYFTV